eukprot:gene12041-11290_t
MLLRLRGQYDGWSKLNEQQFKLYCSLHSKSGGDAGPGDAWMLFNDSKDQMPPAMLQHLIFVTLGKPKGGRNRGDDVPRLPAEFSAWQQILQAQPNFLSATFCGRVVPRSLAVAPADRIEELDAGAPGADVDVIEWITDPPPAGTADADVFVDRDAERRDWVLRRRASAVAKDKAERANKTRNIRT